VVVGAGRCVDALDRREVAGAGIAEGAPLVTVGGVACDMVVFGGVVKGFGLLVGAAGCESGPRHPLASGASTVRTMPTTAATPPIFCQRSSATFAGRLRRFSLIKACLPSCRQSAILPGRRMLPTIFYTLLARSEISKR
jgi:hypothetical protein